MNAMVDLIVEAQHAAIDARPRFLAVYSVVERERNPRLIPMFDRAYCVEPAIGWCMANGAPYAWTHFETDHFADAEAAVKSYLFCGAEYVTLRWYSDDRRIETVETWRAL